MDTCTYAIAVVYDGIDWAKVCLPPAVDAVVDGIEAYDGPERRHGALTRAYYAPVRVSADPAHPDRIWRIAHRQVAVLTPDGTVVATWVDADDAYRTKRPARGGVLDPVPDNGPRDYDELSDLLAREGIEVERHVRGVHLRVRTPHGWDVFLPAPDVVCDDDDVVTDASLLRRFGATLLR